MTAPDPSLLTAFNRFGLGPRPGDLAKTSDPRAALLAELDAPLSPDDPALQRSAVALQLVYEDRERKRIERERIAQDNLSRLSMPAPNVAALIVPPPPAAPSTMASMTSMPPTGTIQPQTPAAPDMMKPQPPPEQQIFRAEAAAPLA